MFQHVELKTSVFHFLSIVWQASHFQNEIHIYNGLLLIFNSKTSDFTTKEK